MKMIQVLKDVIDPYDVCVVDVWGVLYDGRGFLPAALNALKMLKDRGKNVVLLSNSSSSAEDLDRQFSPQGLVSSLYDRFVTSGDYAKGVLPDFQTRYGDRCLMIGSEIHRQMLTAQGFLCVDEPEEADFVFFGGLSGDRTFEAVCAFDRVLEALKARNLPGLCINPDLYSMEGGEKRFCVGAIAQRYEERGGQVAYSGKPHPPVYHHAVRGWNPDPRRVLCIGDALRTDIQGAIRMGYDSLWILGGIHQDMLKLNAPEDQFQALQQVCEQSGCTPTYVQWFLS